MNYVCQTAMMLQLLTERGDAPTVQPSALVADVPLFHVTGEVPLFLQSFAMGRKLVLMPKWDATNALELLEKEQITYFVGVPLMSYEIAVHPEREKYDLSQCKTFAGGGAARPIEHVKKIKDAFKDGFPALGYGLTETNGVGAGNLNENYLAKPNSTGMPSLPLVDMAILDDDGEPLPQGQIGEVSIRSVCNFLGYWKNEDATKAAFSKDGYFRTGDLGYLDEDNYLFIVDRKKDIIIRGGENISCIEVEEAIYAHPKVAECSVFGLPDERFGEIPAAVYFPHPGQSLSVDELQEFLREHIAAFKVPSVMWQSEEQLPRLGTQKVDKRTVKATFAKEHLAAGATPVPAPARDYRRAQACLQDRFAGREHGDKARPHVVGLLKDALDKGRAELAQRLEAKPSAGHENAGLRVPDRPADRGHPRSRGHASLPQRQPVAGGAPRDHGGGRIRPRRDVAAFGCRHCLPRRWQEDRLVRAGSRGDAVSAVGSRPQGRPFDPHARRSHAAVEDRSDDPHGLARRALRMGRSGALR